MKHDIERICGELLDRRRSGRTRSPGSGSSIGDPVEPGIYALFLDDPVALEPLAVPKNGLLYVGMTADKAGKRNHFAHRHSGSSSPRRSLGSLLKQKLQLRASRRAPGLSEKNLQNYRFSGEGEAALTRWMNEHLFMTHVRLLGDKAEIKRAEKQVIARLQPPLNLTDWLNPQKVMVDERREICR